MKLNTSQYSPRERDHSPWSIFHSPAAPQADRAVTSPDKTAIIDTMRETPALPLRATRFKISRMSTEHDHGKCNGDSGSCTRILKPGALIIIEAVTTNVISAGIVSPSLWSLMFDIFRHFPSLCEIFYLG